MKISRFKLIAITPLFIWLSHYLAVFPHEFAHSTMAWALGEMESPFGIDYGGKSLLNLLLLWNIDENVQYQHLFAIGHGAQAALSAFAGSGIGSTALFIITWWLLKNQKVKDRPYLYYFLFWLQLMNLGNFYDYVPIRTFSIHGDMGNITHGLNISPWWIFVIFGYPVAYLMWQFFTNTMIRMFLNLNIDKIYLQAGLMIVCVILLFAWFGGILGPLTLEHPKANGEVTYFLEIASFTAMPGIIVALWPTRDWFRQQLKTLQA